MRYPLISSCARRCCCFSSRDALLQAQLGAQDKANYLAGVTAITAASSAVMVCRVMQSRAVLPARYANKVVGRLPKWLSCYKINPGDRTAPPHAMGLSPSGRSAYVRRPRIGRVADAPARKKKHPHVDDDDDETEYYKVS